MGKGLRKGTRGDRDGGGASRGEGSERGSRTGCIGDKGRQKKRGKGGEAQGKV